jgi:hypothetical protein
MILRGYKLGYLSIYQMFVTAATVYCSNNLRDAAMVRQMFKKFGSAEQADSVEHFQAVAMNLGPYVAYSELPRK